MPNIHNTWTAAEQAAVLAARFANGELVPVAHELKQMSDGDAVAVALLMGHHLSPAKCHLLADLVLDETLPNLPISGR